jgi:multicomponent Na+:H+ antiporter subunit D
VLAASSLLNAAYFLPILYRAWFNTAKGSWPHEHIRAKWLETHAALLFPPLFTALLALAAGLFASLPFSPLEWAKIIANREYGVYVEFNP